MMNKLTTFCSLLLMTAAMPLQATVIEDECEGAATAHSKYVCSTVYSYQSKFAEFAPPMPVINTAQGTVAGPGGWDSGNIQDSGGQGGPSGDNSSGFFLY